MDISILIEENYEWLKRIVAKKRFTYNYSVQDIDDLTHDIIVELMEQNAVDVGGWGRHIHRVLDRKYKQRIRNKEKARIPDDVL